MQFEQARLIKEKENLESHNQWLNEALTNKSNELLALTKEKVRLNSLSYLDCVKSEENYHLKCKVEELTQAIQEKDPIIESLKNQVKDLEKKLNTYMQQLKEAKDNAAITEEQFNQQLATQTRLAELYQVCCTYSQ